MSDVNNKSAAAETAEVFGEMKTHWGWALALGILFLVLGFIGLGMTFFLTVAGVLFFGVLILIGGVLQLADAFKCKGWNCRIQHILIAALYIIAGLVVIGRPVFAGMALTVMVAAILIVTGITRIVMGIQMRGSQGWGWLVFGGAISMLLGAMIIGNWPLSGLWVIGLFIAIEMIIHGWTYIFLAFAAKAAGALPSDSPAEEAAKV
jgi:uncharacterized membrane protein HdeD (DUF308 family)